MTFNEDLVISVECPSQKWPCVQQGCSRHVPSLHLPCGCSPGARLAQEENLAIVVASFLFPHGFSIIQQLVGCAHYMRSILPASPPLFPMHHRSRELKVTVFRKRTDPSPALISG